jgi:ApbE superfamily uncharacterized protein (UPF0280 family)
MKRQPQIRWLADGRRLHLLDGPIDLIVEAQGSEASLRTAYHAAIRRLTGLLDQLCAELPVLRGAADPARCLLKGAVARRMHAAVAPYAIDRFITPMASLDRAYVNNGGDIALHLADGEQFTVGLIDRPNQFGTMRTTTIHASDPSRGVATSGRHGRSFSLGIADAVTVLARTAAQADAAATIIANAVDLPGHPAIVRCPAEDLQPDSDLGARLVTRDVGPLKEFEIVSALNAGSDMARALLASGLIDGAALNLQGRTRVVALKDFGASVRRAASPQQIENAVYA